jgi:hypothetical protein
MAMAQRGAWRCREVANQVSAEVAGKEVTLNKSAVERQMRAAAGLKAAAETGELPLDVRLRRMHADTTVMDQQFEAAVPAAPYAGPRRRSTARAAEESVNCLAASDGKGRAACD